MDFFCRVCGSEKIADTYTVKEMMFGMHDEYRYDKCSTCNVVQLSTPVTDVNKLYPSSYYSFNDRKENPVKEKILKFIYKKIIAKELGWNSFAGYLFTKIKFLNCHSSAEARSLRGILKKDDKILDIGCGSGKLIKAMHTLGIKNVSGIDPFISKTVLQPVPIFKKYVHELNEDEKYDVIMMHHALEHVDNPLAVLQKIKRLLNKGGKAVIRIPVSDSYVFETYGSYWYQLDAPRHVSLHTNTSIAILAEKAGLKVISTEDDATTSQFIISEQYQKGVSISGELSYYTSFFKRFNPFRKTIFSRKDIRRFKKLTRELNLQHRGDQRIFILGLAN